MNNKTGYRNSHLLALTTACLALAAFGCSKTDSLGSVRDGSTEWGLAPSDTVPSVACQLNDGRRVPAGAAYAAEDGCNCCVCTSSGVGECQAAGCFFFDAGVPSSSPGDCQSDLDCKDQGRTLCVFDQGCNSPRGTCMAGGGVCPTFAVSDLAPFQYCGCDGVTYSILESSDPRGIREYPYQPYSHYGACGPNDRADGGPSTSDVPPESSSDRGDVSETYLCQVNADGTCSPVTPDTSCLAFTGHLYDESDNCISNTESTLYCTAWSASALGGLAAAVGCYQIPLDGGALIYWTAESDISDSLWRNRACDASLGAIVTSAARCGSPAADGPSPSSDARAAVFCQLSDGRRIEAGATFADVDGCNCCYCSQDGDAICQAAACLWKDGGGGAPTSCQTDQDCIAQGRTLCVFETGCDSPHGTCMSGPGVCEIISDYCGCDGVTYSDLVSTGGVTHNYPYKPYKHVGACP
jgi:hypothetical protein